MGCRDVNTCRQMFQNGVYGRETVEPRVAPDGDALQGINAHDRSMIEAVTHFTRLEISQTPLIAGGIEKAQEIFQSVNLPKNRKEEVIRDRFLSALGGIEKAQESHGLSSTHGLSNIDLVLLRLVSDQTGVEVVGHPVVMAAGLRADKIRSNPNLSDSQKERLIATSLRAKSLLAKQDKKAGSGNVPSRLNNPEASLKRGPDGKVKRDKDGNTSPGQPPSTTVRLKVSSDSNGVKVTDPLHAPQKHVSATDQYLIDRAKGVDASCFHSSTHFAQSLIRVMLQPKVTSQMKKLEKKLKQIHGSGWADGIRFNGDPHGLTGELGYDEEGLFGNTLAFNVEFDEGMGYGYTKGAIERVDDIKVVRYLLRYTQFPGGYQGGFINYQPRKAWTVVTAFPLIKVDQSEISLSLNLRPTKGE